MVELNQIDRRGTSGRSSSAPYERQFRSSLRTILGMMIPCCGCHSVATASTSNKPFLVMSSYVTGTIFGQRKGRVNFCVQEEPASPPLLLLEFAIPTYIILKEMHSGLLRITLECEKKEAMDENELPSLFSEPVWSMYCNGRKVGFAFKKPAKADADSAMTNFMSLVQSVSTGAGVIPPEEGKAGEDEVIYMRASYERVVGSSDSEAFHMINPDGTAGQELSIFFTRS